MLAAATSNVSFKVSDSGCVRMEFSSCDNFKNKHQGFITNYGSFMCHLKFILFSVKDIGLLLV